MSKNQYGKFLHVNTAYCALFVLAFLRGFFQINEYITHTHTPHITNQGLH